MTSRVLHPLPRPLQIRPDLSKLSVVEVGRFTLGGYGIEFYWKSSKTSDVFYTDVLNFGTSAGMLLITKIWDAVNDPLFGYLADRTRLRGAISTLSDLDEPAFGYGYSHFLYTRFFDSEQACLCLCDHTLVMMAYSDQHPWIADGVITAHAENQYDLSFCASGGIVSILHTKMVAFFGGSTEVDIEGVAKTIIVNEQAGFFWTMVVFAISAMVLFWLCFLTTRERVQPEIDQASTLRADLHFLASSLKIHQISLVGLALLIGLSVQFDWSIFRWVLMGYAILTGLSLVASRILYKPAVGSQVVSTLQLDIEDLLGNRPWMVLFGFGLFQLMSAFIRGGATMYYFKYYIGDGSHVAGFLVATSLAGIAGMLLTKSLTAVFGKKTLMIGMNIGTAICTALVFFLKPDHVYWLYTLAILGAFISGPSPVLLWAMYADVADYSEWKHRRRATGMVFSAATFSQKMGVALGAAATGWVLDAIGYLPPVDGVEVIQSAETLEGLKLMMSLMPAGLMLAAAVALSFYGINRRLLAQIEQELQERRNAISIEASVGK